MKKETSNSVATAQIEKPSFLQKLQTKWHLESIWQVILVLVVFSLTGSTVVMLRKALFGWIGFDETTNIWVKTITYILFVMPAYQILLLAYGTLLGQFHFFWEKEKKMLRAISRLFSR
uniref:DUF6787 domain-containing protein n=1 Tax=Roseihalotalea indica TaxID=2867963 RepID=A0AA49GPK5_9BACT|nr:hypothetical protein K4G66_21245 [Tunicatimonas sp. TK19036]